MRRGVFLPINANKIIEHRDTSPNQSFLEMLRRLHTRFGERLIDLFDVNGVNRADRGGRIKAYINHGRWIAECSCKTALVCDVGFPYFNCYNAACVSAGIWKRIEFPVNRREIENELLRRKLRQGERFPTRNWFSYETLKNLQDEVKDRTGIF